MFFHAGELHQSISKSFPARNINLEIESFFLRDNDLTEAGINGSVLKNPQAKFIMIKVYKELLAGGDFSASSMKMLILDLTSANRNERATKNQPPRAATIRELM